MAALCCSLRRHVACVQALSMGEDACGGVDGCSIGVDDATIIDRLVCDIECFGFLTFGHISQCGRHRNIIQDWILILARLDVERGLYVHHRFIGIIVGYGSFRSGFVCIWII